MSRTDHRRLIFSVSKVRLAHPTDYFLMCFLDPITDQRSHALIGKDLQQG